VFSPVRELLDEVTDKLSQFTNCFPLPSKEFNAMKFTLTIELEEFGIGMHKHNAAMFMLLLGKKKWHMTSSGDLKEILRPISGQIGKSHCIHAY
jgi:hypothetical protein